MRPLKKVHFEVHQTLKLNDPTSRVKAKQLCERRGIKLIEVHALTKSDRQVVLIDPMTSFRFTGTREDLEVVVANVEGELRENGIDVIRTKIEIPPFDKVKGMSNLYYESHIQVILDKDNIDAEMERLSSIAPSYAHLSKNAFKSCKNGVHVMVTIRSQYDLKTLQKRLKSINSHLTQHRFRISDKVEVEKVIYDSRIRHDDIWIKG